MRAHHTELSTILPLIFWGDSKDKIRQASWKQEKTGHRVVETKWGTELLNLHEDNFESILRYETKGKRRAEAHKQTWENIFKDSWCSALETQQEIIKKPLWSKLNLTSEMFRRFNVWSMGKETFKKVPGQPVMRGGIKGVFFKVRKIKP